ncbi:methylated-DNA--[protein]-cysteine S-methyltransferase [Psychrobacter sp. HD31]|uniref:methylated-DNA--[protein]-cysteine S-methyltransferase n=1 Tax=Psychrobacter sp. HD31 TaxID=3112003 RepID=UPI003DA683F1
MINTDVRPALPISVDNQLTAVSSFFADFFVKNTDADLQAYLQWLDKEENPPKSYREHPIDSEQQLNQFKKTFEKTTCMSLGAYVRIKRAYFILNSKNQYQNICQFSYVYTPIGNMLAIFAQGKLCLLEFLERKMLETELNQIIKDKKCQFEFINTSSNLSAQTLQNQLDEYFAGKRVEFDIPLEAVGTPFQQAVWQTLQTIDYGKTISYQDEAEKMGKPTAMRAVANANGKNKISIIIPCHRVIRKSGDLGGYGGGLWRKRFLLALEDNTA